MTVPNPQSSISNPQSSISQAPKAPAYLPLSYITDPRLRIEVYRKLAQATEKSALQKILQELRDRFGPLPRAVDVLLQVAELKLIASEKAVTVIETREYLADRGLIGKASTPVRLTVKSNVEVQELAFYHMKSPAGGR